MRRTQITYRIFLKYDHINFVYIVICFASTRKSLKPSSKIMALDYFGNQISPLTLTVLHLDPFTFYNFRLMAHTPLLGGTLSTAGASSATVQTSTYCAF
jgi:hypothetical protein